MARTDRIPLKHAYDQRYSEGAGLRIREVGSPV
ncbi:MAG: hypothetical protein MAG453_00085 [Calditrichaeota bacterium]|nr:hypothetical protein [Calditrichota bacterium]